MVHKKYTTQTEDHQSACVCELFRSCLYDPNQDGSTTRFQTLDTGLFILSLKRTTKKIHKTILLLLFSNPFMPGDIMKTYILKQTCS